MLLLLVGNIHLTKATHYCLGMAVESQFSLGKTVLDCGMSMLRPDCEASSHTEENAASMPCCDTEYHTLQVDNSMQDQVHLQNWSSVTFVAIFSAFFYQLFQPETIHSPYSFYSPPRLQANIPVLVQSFLL